MNKKIAVVDDHQIVIDGLRLLLNNHQGFEITGEFTKGFDLLEALQTHHYDIVLTDIMMPYIDGYELSIRIKKDYPHIKIIALSMNGDGLLIKKMIDDAHVDAYLLKTAGREELILAIQTVANGDTYFAQEILEELNNYHKICKENELIHLTSRELEIIQCIANDLSNKQIAEELFISERTVETHRKNIFRKTNIHSAIGLVEFARKRKLIS